MDMESKEKNEDKSIDISHGTEYVGSTGFGEVEDNGNEQVDDSPKKKDAVTILSVEVMSSGVEVQNKEERGDLNATERTHLNSNEIPSTTESQKPHECGNLKNESITKETGESDDIPDVEHVTAKTDTKEIEIISIETSNISNATSNPTEENQIGNSTESSSLPILDMETNILDVRVQEESIIDTVMREDDTLPDVVDIPNELSPVAESTKILNDVKSPTGGDLILASTNNADENVSLPVQIENLETSTTTHSTTGLSLLAQYGSENDDSDTESVIEVPTSSNHDYRNKVVEIDSDSDTVSSSGDSEVEYLKVLRKKIEKRMEVDDDDDEDDEDDNGSIKSGNKRKPKPKVKAKGELLLEDLPPIHDLQITVPEDECTELGRIHSIVDQLVLVSALPNSVLLDLETVLFLDKGQKVLGEVFDVLGQVADPLYCVRFNSNTQINEKNIKVNDVVYVAPKTQYTQFIILSSLMTLRGSDASWENDIEPPPRFLDYSDDEQEQLARRQLRNRNRPNDNDDPEKRPRTESEGPQSSSFSRPPPASQYRQPRYPHPREGQESNNQNYYGRPPPRPAYNRPQHHNQQSPNNHHPSSWHSNYYPQPYTAPPQNYGYGGGYPPMPVQNYPQAPMYPMQQMQTIPYPPPQHMRPPPLHNAPGQPQMHPGMFSMQPPRMQGGHFESSPPPPGAQ